MHFVLFKGYNLVAKPFHLKQKEFLQDAKSGFFFLGGGVVKEIIHVYSARRVHRWLRDDFRVVGGIM